jgi:hypothetical protein
MKAVCRALLLAFDEGLGNQPILRAAAATHSQHLISGRFRCASLRYPAG